MIEAGDYVNPTFNYEPRFNKPPLSYWIVAGFYKVFGISVWSARLPIALGAVVILATVFVLGRLAFSTDAGLFAALTLAATPRFLLFSRRIIIDVHTAMYCGLTLLFFALAEVRPAGRRLWLVLMYVAVGLGALTKGPVNAVLPALVFLVYLGLCGRLATVRRLMLPLGTLIVAVIVLPYYAVLYSEHGWTYISSFIFTENIGRFAEGAGAPNRGAFFYIPVVLADLYFPWSLLLPVALALVPWKRIGARWGWRVPVTGRTAPAPVSEVIGNVRLLLALWILVIVGFYSLSRGQQDLYVLPFVAGAAPLVGGLLHMWTTRAASPPVMRVTGLAVLAVSLIMAGSGAAAAWLLGDAGRPISLAGSVPAGAILLAAGLTFAWLMMRGATFAAVAALAASVACAQWVVVLRTLPDYERYKHVPQLAAVIQERASPAAEICTYRLATPSLVFVLGRHVHFVEDEGTLRQLLQSKPELYCMMREEEYEAVRPALGVRTTELADAPLPPTQLRDVWTQAPLHRVVLISNLNPARP